MRYLVLTDIHANLEALDACVRDAATRGYDRVLVLGDVVGYGADPNAAVERVQALAPFAMVRGNHDKVACGLERPDGFNAVAKQAALWTFEVLTPEHRAWLAALPRGPVVVDALVEMCHGSPVDEDTYIFHDDDARRALNMSERPLCLFGHTHHPAAFELSPRGLETIGPAAEAQGQLALRDGAKYLVNPGAVGQPRDDDPRAAYAIVDVEARRMELYRLLYPVELAQAKVIKAGLPEVLAHRLGVGR